MTRRASDRPLRKVTLNLYESDMETLRYLHDNVSEVIQKIVHRYVVSVEDKIKQETKDHE